jgi:hypothetical protein
MPDFQLDFELSDAKRLDDYALLACQDYNLGNGGDWFGSFRGGLYGFHARIHGVATHYHDIHAWPPRLRLPTETEYHLASVFFNMDSAIECFTFALNALGYAARPHDFRDVATADGLKKIAPKDITGALNPGASQGPLSGYAIVFPSLQAYWQANAPLLKVIFEQHDVSKHRETIFHGGMARLDPPAGFYEALGVPDDEPKRALYWPMAEVILGQNLKTPSGQRPQQQPQNFQYLEKVANDFRAFAEESCRRAADDSVANVRLPYSQFKT